MLPRLAAVLLMAAGLQGCLTYEYEHEFWLRVDGSGTVYVTGRPELWTAFKGLGDPGTRSTVTPEAARALFAKAGLADPAGRDHEPRRAAATSSSPRTSPT